MGRHTHTRTHIHTHTPGHRRTQTDTTLALSLSLSLSLALSLSLSFSLTHSLSHSLSLSPTHCLSVSVSLSLLIELVRILHSHQMVLQLLIVSTNAVLVLDQRTLGIKYRIPVTEIAAMSLSPYFDRVLILHLKKVAILRLKAFVLFRKMFPLHM